MSQTPRPALRLGQRGVGCPGAAARCARGGGAGGGGRSRRSRPPPGVPSAPAVDLGSAPPPPSGRGGRRRVPPPAPPPPVLQMGKLRSLEGNELTQNPVEGLDWLVPASRQREGSPPRFPVHLSSFLFEDLVMHPVRAHRAPGPGHGTGDGVNPARLGPAGETGMNADTRETGAEWGVVGSGCHGNTG